MSGRAQRLSFGLLVSLMGVACAGADDEPERVREGRSELVGVLVTDAPAIGQPWNITMGDDGYLWVIDSSGDPYLHLINSGAGTLVRSFGRRGEGPHEFGGTPSLVFEDSSRRPWAWDSGNQRLTSLDENTEAREARPLRGAASVLRAVSLGDRIVGLTRRAAGRFVVFGLDGEARYTVDALLPGTPEVPQGQREIAGASGVEMCPLPERAGFAIVYFPAGRIELYGREAEFSGVAQVPYPQDFIFREAEDGTLAFDVEQIHYVDCAASGDRLYALYSGKPMNAEGSMTGHQVHVFDSMGEFIEVLELDRDVRTIAVDAAGTLLLAAALDPPAIYRFGLPSRLQ